MPSLRQVAFILPLFLLPALSLPAPEPIQLISRGSAPTVAETSYQCFRGTKFPSQWLPWDTLLAINKPAISRGNTPENTENIISSIQSVANAAGILPAFILAMVMQESGGALGHVGDNNKSIGLMQVQLTTGETPIQCDPGTCTADDITGMLEQSIFGHRGTGAPQSPGIAYDLENNNIAAALRVYNTGHVENANNLQVATKCSTGSYVSDIGNRLLGISPDGFPSPQDLQNLCGFVPAATTGC